MSNACADATEPVCTTEPHRTEAARCRNAPETRANHLRIKASRRRLTGFALRRVARARCAVRGARLANTTYMVDTEAIRPKDV